MASIGRNHGGAKRKASGEGDLHLACREKVLGEGSGRKRAQIVSEWEGDSLSSKL